MLDAQRDVGRWLMRQYVASLCDAAWSCEDALQELSAEPSCAQDARARAQRYSDAAFNVARQIVDQRAKLARSAAPC